MKLDGLIQSYDAAANASPVNDQDLAESEERAHRAGIAAVVRALQPSLMDVACAVSNAKATYLDAEMLNSIVDDAIDEILGDAGMKD